jgi:predicted TPR repeat methyltransferase
MSPDSSRSEYVSHLRKLYGLGVKESDNSVAAYDGYLRLMRTDVSLATLTAEAWARRSVMRIMDLGCGDAGMLKELLRKYPGTLEAHGVDLVAPKVGKRGLTVHEGDALAVDLPRDCDLILSFRSMHEMGAVDSLIPKVAEALTVGGKAFLSIRIAEATPVGLEFQGRITHGDLDWLRAASNSGMINDARITTVEVGGTIPGKKKEAFVRGVNVFLERIRP